MVVRIVPIRRVGHVAIGLEPAELFHHVPVVVDARVEVLRAQRRVCVAKREHARGEGLEVRLVAVERPGQPVRPGVEVIGVVVALDGPQGLVPAGHHRHAGAQREKGHAVARGLALVRGDAALVPGVVAVRTAVGRPPWPGLGVVLPITAIEIVEGETVVGDDEIDRVPRLAPIVGVQIRRSGEARRELARRHALGSQLVLVFPQRVAVLVVPLRPARGEVPDLIRSAADGPRLGDPVDAAAAGRGTGRHLRHNAIERRSAVQLVVIEAAMLARVSEHGREIEAEAVDPQGVLPVGQRIDDEVLCRRIECVVVPGGAGVVPVELIVAGERVIGHVVETAERDYVRGRRVGRRPEAAFAGVVVDHVHEDLDAVVVEGLDHVLELDRRTAGALVRRIAPVRSEEVQGHVPPIVVAGGGRRVDVVRVVLGLVQRQKLDGRDAQRGEVRRLERRAGVRSAQARGDGRVVRGQPLDVDLVHDVVLQCAGRLRADAGGVGREDDSLRRARTSVDRAIRARRVAGAVGLGRSLRVVRDLACIRVEKELVGIETIALRVDVGEEPEGRAFGPAGVVRPVRTPGPVAVVDRAGDAVAVLQRGHGRGLRPDVRGRVLDHHVLDLLLVAGGVLVDPDLDARGARGVDLEGDVGLGRVVARAELVRVDGPEGAGREEEGQDGAEDGETDAGKDGAAVLHRAGIMQLSGVKGRVNLRRRSSPAGGRASAPSVFSDAEAGSGG